MFGVCILCDVECVMVICVVFMLCVFGVCVYVYVCGEI